MSSRDHFTRRSAGLAIASILALGLGACFQPLYGPRADGAPVEAVMAQIEVGSVTTSTDREHFGHALRSDLVFALDGSGQSAGDKPYILTATVTDSLQNPIVSSATGRAATGTITAAASWQVENRATGEIVYSGSADASASYDRTIQRFASLRAERDAEIRLARQLAEQIANRLAIKIHTARQSR